MSATSHPLGKCPECKQPSNTRYRPFCSKRCADLDLGRWLAGTYVIGGHADAEEDGLAPGSQEPAGGEGANASSDD